MLMMGLYLTDQVPFKKIYLHGLVNDKHGKKMSKSKGNVLNPIEMAEKYGADALRMSPLVGNTPGTDSNISEDKMRAYKKFANTILNASRFVMQNMDDESLAEMPDLLPEHTKTLADLEEKVNEIDQHFATDRYDLAADAVYHYFWHTFADVIIEENKVLLNEGTMQQKRSAQWTLFAILTTSLKALHPFMPFVTEAVWSHLPKQDTYKKEEMLMVEPWPRAAK
jgi:valyl-tRNA synthetase